MLKKYLKMRIEYLIDIVLTIRSNMRGKKLGHAESVLVPCRVTNEQDAFLRGQVDKGFFSTRQDAIRFYITEKMKAENGKR